MAKLQFTQAPQGFQIQETHEGLPAISYRTAGMGCLAVFLGGWLVFWTGVCVYITGRAVAGEQVKVALVLLWAGWAIVAVGSAFYFCATTTFTFMPDELVVEQRLGLYRRRRPIKRSSITTIRQIKDSPRTRIVIPGG